MGTRFLATPEANAHLEYKARLAAASEEASIRTILFGNGWPNAPHRALKTPFVSEWIGHEHKTQDSNPEELVIGSSLIGGAEIPIHRFVSMPPNRDANGEIESMALLAGQSVGLVHDIRPAAEIVRETVEGAADLIRRLSVNLSSSSGKAGS
jgi:enoyl-[acyl-carrier protein] reductase II